MKRFLIGALIVLTALTGCRYIPDDADGSLMITLPSKNARGVENVVFETAWYTVSVKNTDKAITYDSFRVETTGMEKPMSVASGNTTVSVDAYNSEGVKIGTGSASIFVRPMQLNEVKVTVDEITGNADITVEVKSAATGLSLTAKLFRPGEAEPAYAFALTPSTGTYSGVQSVAHGTYKVFVNNGKEDLFLDTVRIAAGHPITVKGTVGDNWQITVEIIDSILPTPKVTVSGGKATYASGESYSLTASVTGLESPKITWFLDGREIKGQNALTIDGKLPTDGTVRAGEHIFTVLVEKGPVAWTGDHTFEVTE